MSASKCRRHPRQVVVGVCAACLKERLLALMIEEEEYEIARNSFASSSSLEVSACMQDSPPMYKAPGGGAAFAHSSSDSSFNIFTDHCKTSIAPSSALRRHGMEYNREDVKHVASLYLQRHHSLSSSPLQKPTNLKASSPFPSSLHDQGDRERRKSNASLCKDQSADRKADDHIVAASIPRKKRGSLWSLLQRHGFEPGSSSMRKDCNKVEQPRRLSLQGNSTLYKSAYMNRGPISADNGQHRLSYASSSPHSDAFDRSSKANASSLNSSPRSLRSKHVSGCASSSHMLSPAPSRHCTPLISPLQMKDELTRHAEVKLLPGRRHSFADDSIYDIADDHKPYQGSASDASSKSWISSLFNPSRRKSSKSLSSKGNHARAYATHNPSRRDSVSASPEMAPRRKSVSFLDEHVASKSPRTTSRFKTSPPKNFDHDSTKMRGSDVQDPKASSPLLGLHDNHGFTGENAHVPKLGDGRRPGGVYHLDIAGHQDQQKSPRMRMSSFLTKRRNSMGAMDCTRDMRVSPAPMLSSTEIRNPASHAGHRNLPLMIKEDDEENGSESNFGSVHTGALRKSGHDSGRSSMIRLVPASMLDAEVEDVKELTQIDHKAMDIRNSSMSKSKSWSSTWSKTLSPMLGLRGKKKKKKQKEITSSSNGAMDSLKQTSINAAHYDQTSSINNNGTDYRNSLIMQKQACNNLQHHELQHSTFDHNLSTSSCSPAMDSCSRTHCMGQLDSDSYLSSPASLFRKDYNASREGLIKINAELRPQISTPKLSPNSVFTPNSCIIKRPPQQYSFLSKDYSAFSFYFSPRSSTSNTNQTISDRLRRLSAADQPTAGSGTPPRHSVDGTFPSLFRKPPPSAAFGAPLLANAINGR